MNVRVVNPSHGSSFFGAANSRRRKSRSMVVVAAPKRRRRRSTRNALIMPMASAANPLILPNRGSRRHQRGRRRGRRNASIMSNPFGGGFLGTAVTGLAGGGAAFWTDRLVLNKLGRAGTPGADGLAPSTANGAWIRNAARVVAGGIAAYFWPGNFGAAINGGFAYPVWGAIEELMNRPAGAGATSAYLNGTDAYLSDVLDGMF